MRKKSSHKLVHFVQNCQNAKQQTSNINVRSTSSSSNGVLNPMVSLSDFFVPSIELTSDYFDIFGNEFE